MNNKILWNLKANLYRNFRNKFPFRYFLQQENKSLLSLLNKVPSNFQTVIDLGTGEGNSLQFIGGHVIKLGVDSSFSMLINARKNVTAELVNNDLLHLSLKDQIADLVLIIGVLEYFCDLNPLFREIHRITKADAHIIISYSPNNLWTFLRLFLGYKIYPLKFEKIINIIERNGFQFITINKLLMQHQILIKPK